MLQDTVTLVVELVGTKLCHSFSFIPPFIPHISLRVSSFQVGHPLSNHLVNPINLVTNVSVREPEKVHFICEVVFRMERYAAIRINKQFFLNGLYK